MKIIKKKKIDIDLPQYIRKEAKESDFNTLIDADCMLLDENDTVIFLYIRDIQFNNIKNITKVLQDKLEYFLTNRPIGELLISLFGYRPEKMKDNTVLCKASAILKTDKESHDILVKLGEDIMGYYKKYLPEIYRRHMKIVDSKIADEFRIEGTPYTSGMINKNNAIKYHWDIGNFAGTFQTMAGVTQGTSGGYLSLPEFDVGFDISNGSVCVFNGRDVLHGVTPVTYESEESYRYTIVYYSLEDIWECVSAKPE